MKVSVQFEHDEVIKKKKRKLESSEESPQLVFSPKKQKGRDRRKKSAYDKKISKVITSYIAPNSDDDTERERKKFKPSKDHLLKSLYDSEVEEGEIHDDNDETSTQPQTQTAEENSMPEVKETMRQTYKDPRKRLKEKEHKRIENLTPEQEERIRQIYKEQYKRVKSGPFLELKDAGEEASLSNEEDVRYPLVFPDIEEVLTHLQYNRHLTRWLHLKRASKINNTILLSVEGPGLEDYLSQAEDCPTLQSCRVGVEYVSPLSYGDCVEHAFANKIEIKPPPEANIKEGFQNMKSCPKKDGFIVGLDTLFNIHWNSESKPSGEKMEEEKVKLTDMKRKGSKIDRDLTEAETDNKEADPSEQCHNRSDLSDFEEESYDFCVKNKQALPISLYKRDNFSRLDLLMTPREMANHKYPLPFIPRYQAFVRTKDEYKEITERSPMFGLDCEMCETKYGSELTRISVVNEKHEVVYEKLVKPDNKITNYLTKYSGITAKMMNPVQTKLSDVQRDLKTLLPADAILVGQSLNCDLIAMKMMHPYIIDTSLIFNLTGIRQCKTKLKTLCAEFLSERIQASNRKGHDSIEDALAALKLVQKKLNHSLEWGDAVLGYKRTEEECRQANLELIDKEKNGVKIRLRLALNAIVDDSSLFDSPTHHLAKQKKRCRPNNKHLYY